MVPSGSDAHFDCSVWHGSMTDPCNDPSRAPDHFGPSFNQRLVGHLLGRPDRAWHLIMHERQLIASPVKPEGIDSILLGGSWSDVTSLLGIRQMARSRAMKQESQRQRFVGASKRQRPRHENCVIGDRPKVGPESGRSAGRMSRPVCGGLCTLQAFFAVARGVNRTSKAARRDPLKVYRKKLEQRA